MRIHNNGSRAVIRWLYTGLFMVFAMVIIGAVTRLTESGLSITEWKVASGTIPPLTQEDWLGEFMKYQQTPEYTDKNVGMTLDEFKQIFFWEWFHRFWGRLIGVVFLVPFFIFWRKGYLKGNFAIRLVFIFILGGFQAFLGLWMVKSGLAYEPRVSHYRLAIHLSTALLLFGLIWWTILDIKYKRLTHLKNKFPGGKRLFKIGFVILCLQIVYGAFVAGRDAGQEINTWPLMDGEFVKSGAFSEEGRPFYYNIIGEPIPDAADPHQGFPNNGGIQFIHRWLAFAVYFWVWALWIYGRSRHVRSDQMGALNLLLLLVHAQLALGIFTLLYNVPIVLGVLHQAGAVFLLMCALYFYHQLRGTE